MPAVGFLMFLCHFFWFWVHAVTHGQSRLEPPDTVKRCGVVTPLDLVIWCRWPNIPKYPKSKGFKRYLTRCDAHWPDPAFAVASGQNSTAGKI